MDQTPSMIGNYAILESLGTGTTGSVYKARDKTRDRLVALKLPYLTNDDRRATRFARLFREARNLAAVKGPNIVAAFDIAEELGIPFYTREFVDGTTLEQLANARSVDLLQGVRIIREVAIAMPGIHRQGLVHQNLHPANVLVSSCGAVKLIGFGAARAVDDASVIGGKPTGVSIQTDVRGLQWMLCWLCINLRQSIPPQLEFIQQQGNASSASEIADRLSAWLQDMKGV